MLPVIENKIFTAWQIRFEAWKKGERPFPYPTRIISKNGLALLTLDGNRYKELLARWAEDVIIRAFLENPIWQILFREDTPFHNGFDFVVKDTTSGEILIVEMKMTKKVGMLKTYLKMTKTKGRQMSMKWVKKTTEQVFHKYPLAYFEINNAITKGLLRRRLIVANHEKKPKGWLSASMGNMGMKGFFENDFKKTPGFN